jgi:ABC-type glutathione transport system ATPase component
LPEQEEAKTELQIEKLKYDPNQQLALYNELMLKKPPTQEQLFLLNDVKNCLLNKIYIVQGQGGSGKTTTAKIIIAWARSQGYLVKGCASTAFAASIYNDFHTAHALFEIPVIDDNESYEQENDFKSNLDKNPER